MARLFIDGLLVFVGRILNFLLDEAALDGLQHSAENFDLSEIFSRALFNFVRERLDVIRSGQRIDRLRSARLVGNYLLRAQGDAGCLLGGQGQSFVVRIGVQRLRSAEDSRHRLNRGADDVVFRLLRGESRAGGLGVEAEHPRLGISGLEMFAHDARPHAAGGAELGDFFQEIIVRVEEEGQARRELVDIQASFDRGLDVSHAVTESERDFLHGGRSGLAHVVAGD